MRRLWIAAMVAMLAAACSHSAPPTPRPSRSGHALPINPANIKRIGRELPSGYEVTSVAGVFAPAAIWGVGPGSTADPRQCARLAEPVDVRGESGQGLSGSGAGGIVYAIVAAATSQPIALEPKLVADCGQWVMNAGHVKASVRLVDPPRIDGAETLGMVSDTTTSVEGSTEIDSRAHTFVAYLGDYYAFTMLITDPGSPHPLLAPQFAADLLVKTVSALRG